MSDSLLEEKCAIVEAILSEINIPANSHFSLTAPCCSTQSESNADQMYKFSTLISSNVSNTDSESTPPKPLNFFSNFGNYAISLSCTSHDITSVLLKVPDTVDFVPTSLSKLTGLTHISISAKKDFFLTDIFENMDNLTGLSIRGVKGTIHVNSKTLANLGFLDISGKDWKWDIPENLHKLTYLDLHNGNIGKFIPENVWNLNSLKILGLNNCSLSGRIPNKLFDISTLEQVSLSDNQLEGDVDTILSLSSISRINLENNRISGVIKDLYLSKKRGSSMQIELRGNNISGDISFLNTQTLGEEGYINLNLGNNKLTGNITNVNTEFIGYLYLDNNLIEGSIENLKRIPYISNNRISGKATLYLRDLPKISGNQIEELEILSGSYFESHIFYMGKNRFQQIPKPIVDNKFIKTLVFTNNALKEVEYTPNIITLVLDYNNITKLPQTDPPASLVSCSIKHNPIVCDKDYFTSPWKQLCNTDCVGGSSSGSWITSGIVLALVLVFILSKFRKEWKQIICKYFWVLDVMVDIFVLIWTSWIGFVDVILILHFVTTFISAVCCLVNLKSENGFCKILGHAIGDLSQVYMGIILGLKTHTYVPLLSAIMALITINIGTSDPKRQVYEKLPLL